MSDKETSGINPCIQDADAHCGRSEQVRGNVGIHYSVEIVQKERAAIRGNAAAYLKPLFKCRERTPESKDFDSDSIQQCANVQRREPRRLRVNNAPKITQAM